MISLRYAESTEAKSLAMNVKREPFSRRVNNATDNFYESAAYIKRCVLQPLYAVNGNTNSVVVTGGGEGVCQLARQLQARPIGAKPMQGMVLGLFTLLAVSVSATASTAQSRDQSKKQPAKQEQKTSAMTGCVDQQEGRYVLTDDRSLAPIADLEADGFPTEGFAKHVGHKVTVRGMSTSNGARPLFKVRAVETISETCAPQAVPRGNQ
jgi:hypothetical protein